LTTSPSPATRLCWIYPDRGTAWQRDYEEQGVWGAYREIATTLGLRMSLHKPEEVAVDGTDPARPRVFLNGERVTPEDIIFVTAVYSLPHQVVDVANQVYLFTVLETLGFYLPIPPWLTYLGEDKLATVVHLAQSPVPPLPTVRVASGREAMTGHYDEAFANLDYPMIIKPANWGMGLGISVVHNVHDLRGVIGLAGGAETPLVAQPYIRDPRETRVYVVDGQAHTVLQGSKEGYCLMVTKTVGGRHERGFTDLPAELDSTIAYLAGRLPTPYFSVDFISDGERFWLSEIEVDGAIGFSMDKEQDVVARSLVTARFEAYQRGHARWLADRVSR
jgi:glutathione synthase/RimK-type ligase-like ATP-grasp enzyme